MSDGGRLLGAAATGLFSNLRAQCESPALSLHSPTLTSWADAALAAPGQPQTAVDTIDKLNDRLANGESMEDRKAALLGIKGLSRDWKAVRRVPNCQAIAL
jgi:hypothetical protein